jgi:hypothetical protein
MVHDPYLRLQPAKMSCFRVKCRPVHLPPVPRVLHRPKEPKYFKILLYRS